MVDVKTRVHVVGRDMALGNLAYRQPGHVQGTTLIFTTSPRYIDTRGWTALCILDTLRVVQSRRNDQTYA